jgi:hypothetical protein
MSQTSRRRVGVAVLSTVLGTLAAAIPATSVAAAGKPAPAQLQLGVADYDYGSVTTGQTASHEFTLSNNGGKSAGGVGVSVSGDGFAITASGCGKALKPSATCNVTVTFAPGAAGGFTGTLTASARGVTSVTTALTGTGTAASADRYLYWGSPDIGRALLDGSSPNGEFVVTDQTPMSLDVGAGYLYWTMNGTGGGVQRIPVDGSGTPETVASSTEELQGVAVDEPYVYWANYGTKEIWRANLDGTSAEALLTGLGNVIGLDVADGYVYWSESGPSASRILRVSLSDLSATPQVLYEYAAESTRAPAGLQVGGGRVYWAESDWNDYAGSVQSVPVDGGTARVDVALPAPIRIDDVALDVAGGWLYYTANNDTYPSNSAIERRALDGTGSAQTVVPNLWLVYGLAIG